MALEQGMDTARIREIAGQLKTEAGRVEDVNTKGTQQVGTLESNWLGTDSEAFAREWQEAAKQLAAASDALTAYSTKAEEQATQQDEKSKATGN